MVLFLAGVLSLFKIQENQIDPYPNTCEKSRDAPPISIAILLQKYALLLAKSRTYTTNFCIVMLFQRAPNPPAQPRLSRVKRRSSPARGYKFGCVCSCMAGHCPGILMTPGSFGTNTPKCVPLAVQTRVGLELADFCRSIRVRGCWNTPKRCLESCSSNQEARDLTLPAVQMARFSSYPIFML